MFVIAALVVAASLITLWKNFSRLGSKGHHDSRATIVDKYAAALSIAMQFFNVQKCKQLTFSPILHLDSIIAIL